MTTTTSTNGRYRVQLTGGRSYCTSDERTAQTVAYRLACKSRKPIMIVDRAGTSEDGTCVRWDVYPE